MTAEGNLSLSDLLDLSVFQNLSDSFRKFSRLPTAILDCQGKVLVASGWRAICTKFHRQHPDTAVRCLESDTILASGLAQGQKINVYQCKNGLMDVASPIIIDGMYLGNLFIGQFLSQKPDISYFTRQAERFGFDTPAYLTALADVPVLSDADMRNALDYLGNLTVVIVTAGLARKKLRETNQNLEEKVRARTKALESEKRFSESLISSLPGVMYVIDAQGRFHNWNRNLETVSGYSKADILKKQALEFIAPADRPGIQNAFSRVFEQGEASVEAGLLTRSGKRIPYLFTGVKYPKQEADYLIGAGLDISERVETEKQKAVLIETLQQTLAHVKQLSGLLPICASCKKIRDDKGYWNQLESYIHQHSQAKFSHGLCPECSDKLYGDQVWYNNYKKKKKPDKE